MEFSSINIQGNIISSEILNKIRNEDIKYQHASDFALDKKTTVRDEIGIAWAATRAHYTAFKMRVDRLKEGDSGASETRNSWMIPVLRELGYDVEKATTFTHPDTQKTYAISHKAANLSGFPIHIMGIHDDLDRRRENSGPRLSPHALTQEFLNNTEHTYALVTNGHYLRLLRDATRLVRLSYLEFDLQKMMEEELYADFAILFRLLHATRMPKNVDALEDSFIEYYHQESLASGSRIREKLSEAVENSIKTLANGFLSHPENDSIRKQVQSGNTPAADFYLHQLRLIYRFLFLIVTEERNLIYPETKDETIQRQRKIYYDYYSIERLRKLAAKLHYVDGRKNNLWEGLKSTFLLFEKGFYGEKLGIKPLGSGLFAGNALGSLQVLKLDNSSLLKVIRYLTLFENDNKQFVRVNYSDLDVEEFGSVYEGLLEYDAEIADINGSPFFRFKQGTGRSSSGSHYTPEELVKPLIRNSLDYLIADKLKERDPEKALLSLKIADVACGSGHILLSAARRIAFELACIRETKAGGGKDKVEQPSPKFVRHALRDAIKNCIYGVDKNPLAVELCKVALWLEAHNPGEPLNFLDHHIKCGDAIVGLAHKEDLSNGIPDEAFIALSDDEKELNYESEDKKGNKKPSTLAAAFSKRNKLERETRTQSAFDFEGTVGVNLINIFEEFQKFEALPETTPDEIATKEKAYVQLLNSGTLRRLKTISDIQIAQFFIPKTVENKDKLVTDANYFRYLKGEKPIPQNILAETIGLSSRRFFHWFLEFPEVFQRGGFDIILGNPPYLHNQKLSGFFGHDYLNYIQNSSSIDGSCDLVTYFLRRIFNIITEKSFFSIITTNSVCQGRTREQGLDYVLQNGGNLNFVRRSIKWTGVADLYVSCFTLNKGNWNLKRYLDNKEVNNISAYFDDTNDLVNPYTLKSNLEMMFQGSIYLGEGFLVNDKEKAEIISADAKNSEVIFGLLSGRDVNESYLQKPSSNIINFFDWSEDKAKTYERPYLRLLELVKPERDKQNRKANRDRWWIYAERRPGLMGALSKVDKCFITLFTSKYLSFSQAPIDLVFTNGINVLATDRFYFITFLQSNIHLEWARKYGSTLKNDLRYTPTKCFEPFPFPKDISQDFEVELEEIGEEFLDFRKKVMVQSKSGLTKLYNLFHKKNLKIEDIIEETHEPDEICKNTFDNLIILRQLHKKMDEAVLKAYGWKDINLMHDFHDIEYLPEKDRVRYSIHPDARKEILKRLLDLNHELYEQEIAQGLHPFEAVEAFFQLKGEPVPAELLLLLGKNKKEKAAKAKNKKSLINRNESVLSQPEFFELPNLFNTNDMKEFSLNEGIYSVKDTVEITGLSADKIKRWFSELSKEQYEGLDTQGRSDVDSMRISFHGLIELVVIGTLRENGFTLKKILKSRNDLKQKTNTVYPFATNNVRDNLKVAGNNIVFEFPSGIITLDGTGQYNIDFIKTFFKDIFFDVDGVAQRIIPSKGKGKIVIDPKEGGGKPAIIGKEVWVDLINNIYTGTESIQMIKEQYNLDEDEILAAVEFSK